MSSPNKIEPCGEHKLSVKVDERENKQATLQRAQWLRAAILGANDGLLTTTSLMLGVGAAKEDQRSMILSGLAGTLAGACSMAIGEFVSVSTQRDIERAVLEKRVPKARDGDDVTLEITPGRNPVIVDKTTVFEVNPGILPKSVQLHRVKGTDSDEGNPCFSPKINSLGRVKGTDPNERASPRNNSPVLCSSPVMKVVIADSRISRMKGTENEDDDEVESSKDMLPNPYKAAGASAGAFVCGSLVPLVPAICVAENMARLVVIVIVTSIALVLFGGIGARLGGSPLRASALRVLLGGWISMAITYGLLKPLDRDDEGKKID